MGLVQLYQVLGLAPRIIQGVVQPVGAAMGHVGDDIANVETLRCGLNACGATSLAAPGFGTVAGLGIAAHQAAQMVSDLRSRRCLSWTKQHRHWPVGCGVVDVDRLEASLVIVRVEQRELLMAVHNIDGVIDIERDGFRRALVAGAIDVDHGVGHANDLAQVRRIFPPRHRRLRTQIGAAVGQTVAGELEAGVCAQMVEIIGILLAASDGQHAGTHDVFDAVRHTLWIAPIGKQRRQTRCHTDPPLGRRQQHDPAIGGEAPAVKRCDPPLAADRWKFKREHRIVGHGSRSRGPVGVETQTLNVINGLNHIR